VSWRELTPRDFCGKVGTTMNKQIADYLLKIQGELQTGQATEHSYRGFLKELIETIDGKVTAINEPKRQKCGAPDFVVQKKAIPIGFVEAKNIGTNLDEAEKSDQLKRYKASLDNLILTDYLEFRFFVDGEKVETIRVAEREEIMIVTNPDQVEILETMLKEFVSYHGQTIKSAPSLQKQWQERRSFSEMS